MAADGAFDLAVHQAENGSLVGTLTVGLTWRVIDIKLASEALSETPAKYQQLLLSRDEGDMVLLDDQTLSSVGYQVGSCLSVIYLPAGELDFVCAVRDGINDTFLFRYLVAAGADINAKADGRGRRPDLNDGIIAAQDGHLLSIAMQEASALHHAANYGHAEVCRLILEEPSFSEINSLTKTLGEEGPGGDYRMTALHVAALNSHAHICCMLLRDERFTRVSDKIRTPYAGRDALALACQKGLPSVVRMLLNDPRCSSINDLVDEYDTTILMLAACTNTPGNIKVCKMIFKDSRFTRYEESSCRGAGTPLSGTAYDIAKANGLTEIVRLWDEWCS